MAQQQQQEDKPEMTAEERLQWLRDRGVQIETPEERRQQATTSTTLPPPPPPPPPSSTMSSPTLSNPISYVLIPADSSQPMKEFTFSPTTTTTTTTSDSSSLPYTSIDALEQHLKPIFTNSSSSVDVDLLVQQQAEQHYTHLISGSSDSTPPPQQQQQQQQLPTVSKETLQQVAQQGGIETFSLVHATPTNQYTSIVVYLDEVGMLKRLPLNTRIMEYAKLVGYNPPPQFYGDVFIGRIVKQPHSKPCHKDFSLGQDTAMDASWLQQAMTDNLSYQMERNRILGGNSASQQQPAVAGDNGVAKQEAEYSWTQTEEELEVVVPLPSSSSTSSSIPKSKQIKVVFKPNSFSITNTDNKDWNVTVKLFERVDVDGCTWTVEKCNTTTNDPTTASNQVVITMEKMDPALWPRIQF